jgi:hypothetical protein
MNVEGVLEITAGGREARRAVGGRAHDERLRGVELHGVDALGVAGEGRLYGTPLTQHHLAVVATRRDQRSARVRGDADGALRVRALRADLRVSAQRSGVGVARWRLPLLSPL